MESVFLLDRVQTHTCLMQCIRLSQCIRVAVAWAKWDHAIEQALRLHSKCVKTFLVGTSFGRTDAALLRYWQSHPAFWTWPNFRRGVFHPKVYLLRGKTWSLGVVGSSNLTQGGLAPAGSGNVEQSMAFFEGTPEPGMAEVQKHIRPHGTQPMMAKEPTMKHDFFGQMEARMSEMVQQAHRVNVHWLGDYETLLKNQHKRPDLIQRSLLALDAPVNPANPTEGSAVEVSVSVVDQALLACNLRSPTEWEHRLIILRQAQGWWKRYAHFNRMPIPVRKALAGVIQRVRDSAHDGVDWHLFGHMRVGRGPFRELLQQEDSDGLQILSHALDAIPLQGAVTQRHYQRFSERYLPLHGHVTKPSIAMVTRLLALKRPDVFMPITSANLTDMAQCLGVRAEKPRLFNYWHMLSELRHKFDISPPDSMDLSSEEGVAEFSPMALLDAVFYKEKQKPEKQKPLRP